MWKRFSATDKEEAQALLPCLSTEGAASVSSWKHQGEGLAGPADISNGTFAGLQ